MTTINTFNLKLLSHSGLQTLRSCPRKFELEKLSSRRDGPTIHTAFGSAMGDGIQKILETNSLDAGLLAAFKAWNVDLYDTMPKAFKSFPHVILALENFYTNILPQFGDWELLWTEKNGVSKPACELSFVVALPLGYYYRGFLDAVLKNKVTGKFRVLELKTTGSRMVDEANYANSFQGVGYSIILDKIAPQGYSDYEVLYLVFKTFNQTFEDYPFVKLSSHRMNWLNDLLLTVETIELYKRTKRFSTNGDSCKNFGKLCRFYEECNYANESIFAGAEVVYEPTINLDEFDYQFTYEELLNYQTSVVL